MRDELGCDSTRIEEQVGKYVSLAINDVLN